MLAQLGLQALRRLLRSTRRQPVFYGSAVLLAALPVAAATAVFSALNAIVLTAVPFPHPEELVEVRCTDPTRPPGPCSVPVAVSIWKQARFIDELAYYSLATYPGYRDAMQPGNVAGLVLCELGLDCNHDCLEGLLRHSRGDLDAQVQGRRGLHGAHS
jgi:hypothetical protein